VEEQADRKSGDRRRLHAAPEGQRDDQDDDQVGAAAERGQLRGRRDLEDREHEHTECDLHTVEDHRFGSSTRTSVMFRKSANGVTWITLVSPVVSLPDTELTRPMGMPAG